MVRDHVQIAKDDIGIPQGGGYKVQRCIGVERIVGIQETDGIPGEEPQPLVHRVVDAFVLLRDQAQRRALERSHDRSGLIGRSAVDDHQLLVGLALLKKRFDRLPNRRTRIKGDRDDADLHIDFA